MEKLKILFKTKGGHKEGMGDVTYSLALAEEFRNRGYDVFFVINKNQNVIALISEKDFKYRAIDDLPELEEYLRQQSINIVILSQLDTPQDEALIFKRHSEMLVTVDDKGKAASLADLCFNVLYPIKNSYSEFKYIALSEAFKQKHDIPKVIKKQVETLLVTQGGSDTYGFIPKIIRALYCISKNISIDIIIGPNFSHYQELDNVLSKAPRNFNIIKAKNDLSNLMMEADLAISAAGVMLFELACLGTPTVVVCAEPFEVETANRLQESGFAVNLGFGKDINEIDIKNAVYHLIDNRELRAEMSERGKNLIDGKGTKRIVGKIGEFLAKNEYSNN